MPGSKHKAFRRPGAHKHDGQRSMVFGYFLELMQNPIVCGSLKIDEINLLGLQYFLGIGDIFNCNYLMARLRKMG